MGVAGGRCLAGFRDELKAGLMGSITFTTSSHHSGGVFHLPKQSPDPGSTHIHTHQTGKAPSTRGG